MWLLNSAYYYSGDTYYNKNEIINDQMVHELDDSVHLDTGSATSIDIGIIRKNKSIQVIEIDPSL